MNFLIKSFAEQGEGLSSFIHRISKLNYVSPNDIWRLLRREATHYPQSSISSIMDIYPECFIKLDKLSSMLDLDKNSLERLTFMPVYQKLGIPKSAIPHSRILSTLIGNYRKFCPVCIQENVYYKLLWQVQEVNFCTIHNIRLQTSCMKCGKKIPILPSNSDIGFCPYCGSALSQTDYQAYETSSTDVRIIEDWSYLLNTSTLDIKLVNGFPSEQSLAMRLLFFTNNHRQELNRKEKKFLTSILPLARNTSATKTFIHLKMIFHFIRKLDISLEDFLTKEVPQDFITYVFNLSNKITDNYSCIAPWCSYYQKPGSLVKTPTHGRLLSTGQELTIYMFCNSCGIEYAINKNDNTLFERDYFIDLAWFQIREELNKGYSYSRLIEKTHTSGIKLRRAIIFLAANSLIDYKEIPFDLPSSHDPEIISLIQSYIRQGIPVKQIFKKLGMKNNYFLFYWLYAEIRKTYLTEIHKKPNKYSSKEERTIQFEKAVNKLLLEDRPIIVAEICKELNISPGTLANWGFLDKVKEYKAIQTDLKNEQLKEYIDKKTEEILSSSSNKQITLCGFYKALGIKKKVLIRRYPDFIHFINAQLKTGRKYH